MTETNRTFTGQRLDWEKCLRFDRRVYPLAYEVACAIASHARPNGTAYVSDETLADEVGCAPRNVYRARVRLRQSRWLKWRRTGDANIYTLQFDQVSAYLDLITAARDARKEQRKKRRNRFRDSPPESDHKPANSPPESDLDQPPESDSLPSRNSLEARGLPRKNQETQMGVIGKMPTRVVSTRDCNVTTIEPSSDTKH
jgi:hypothetical protein